MSLIDQKNINELVSLYKNKLFKELLKKSEILLEDNPKDYFVNNISGMAYINLKNFQKASEFFSKAIEINPNNYEAHNNLATLLSYVGKFKESIDSYKNALKINPNSAEILNNIGNTFKDLGKFNEAINYYFKYSISLMFFRYGPFLISYNSVLSTTALNECPPLNKIYISPFFKNMLFIFFLSVS